jgi:hypothetical protein
MSKRRHYAAYRGERLVENTELAVDGRAVVVDSFSSKPISFIEGINTTEWVLDAPPGARQTAP